MKIYYPTVKEIIHMNHWQILSFSPSEQIGVKDTGLLESAINRPKQSVLGEDAYPTIYDKGAALFQSLVLKHPFYNANKRTALMALHYFLEKNGRELNTTDKEMEDFTVSIATDHLDIETISRWIKK